MVFAFNKSVYVVCLFRRVGKIAKRDYYHRHVRMSVRSFVHLSVCLSVRTEQFRSHLKDFREIKYLSFFSENLRENSRFVKTSQE